MKSIRKTLTLRLSIIISLLVITVLLAADIGVDTWVEKEFNQAMKAKVGMIQSLVSKGIDNVEVEFIGQYLPEFEGTSSPEYFQLWHQGKTLKKSKTLVLNTVDDLPYKNIGLNDVIIENITLPDGRSGRVIYTKYVSQIDLDDKAEGDIQTRQPIVVAYATSTELLNFTLWFIDGAFLVALIIVPLGVRFAVCNTVSHALAPLDALNVKIKGLRFTARQKHETLCTNVEELEPITQSLNHFIEDNYALYLREKRLTSDIAHELKTPVAELINMAEVAIKFPGEERLEKGFKRHVLQIGSRMKSIISGLMLIQQYSVKRLELDEDLDVCKLVAQIIVNSKKPDCFVIEASAEHSLIVKSHRIAVESIISNLLDNAIGYGAEGSKIQIHMGVNSAERVYVEVTNKMSTEVSDSDLKHMFEPFWQKDASRSSEDNFGLGLSIVSALSEAIGAEVSVSKSGKALISFGVMF